MDLADLATTSPDCTTRECFRGRRLCDRFPKELHGVSSIEMVFKEVFWIAVGFSYQQPRPNPHIIARKT